MAPRNMTKMNVAALAKRCCPVLFGAIALGCTVFPVSAAETAATERILSFWSALISWFATSLSVASSAFYVPGSGMTVLGVLACALLALAAVCALFALLWRFFRFVR